MTITFEDGVRLYDAWRKDHRREDRSTSVDFTRNIPLNCPDCGKRGHAIVRITVPHPELLGMDQDELDEQDQGFDEEDVQPVVAMTADWYTDYIAEQEDYLQRTLRRMNDDAQRLEKQRSDILEKAERIKALMKEEERDRLL